ncbi:hypothetical protein [Noviherbaspirillum sp.]|uniref:hypothetical protein n=1 Tax=Noviherbaspirillum sp. TaxID=1926288 RepID=UPI002D229721|nr:hypothetical protein [Noviherbaspirillum sp.]HZW21564.1 hypothetical protein [Noviherbaspirillum sp.]
MAITVHNSRPDAPSVTLFGRLDDGTYAAEVMAETSVPYSSYWDNAIEQVAVYIEPSDDQLQRVVAALNEGRLDFSTLQNFGSANGGESTLPI